tara:strand:- start:682 stop:1122 length:441 start_codon:yes stop_codon:yes gene_type:complete
MKQAKIETIQKTGKTYEYDNEKGKIKYMLYNIKLSIFPDMVNYSYPIDKELSFKENDKIEFLYNEEKNKIFKVQKVKQAMYGNFTKEEKVNYQNTEITKQRSIEYQSARNVISQLYSGFGHKISLDEIAEKTVYLYNKQQEFFNNK